MFRALLLSPRVGCRCGNGAPEFVAAVSPRRICSEERYLQVLEKPAAVEVQLCQFGGLY